MTLYALYCLHMLNLTCSVYLFSLLSTSLTSQLDDVMTGRQHPPVPRRRVGGGGGGGGGGEGRVGGPDSLQAQHKRLPPV